MQLHLSLPLLQVRLLRAAMLVVKGSFSLGAGRDVEQLLPEVVRLQRRILLILKQVRLSARLPTHLLLRRVDRAELLAELQHQFVDWDQARLR